MDTLERWHTYVEGNDLAALDALITEFKVMMRPLKALNTILPLMRARLTAV